MPPLAGKAPPVKPEPAPRGVMMIWFSLQYFSISETSASSLGKITASLTSFNSGGFTINVTYTNGTVTVNHVDPLRDVQPEDVLNEGLIVLYTAYK